MTGYVVCIKGPISKEVTAVILWSILHAFFHPLLLFLYLKFILFLLLVSGMEIMALY